MPTLQAMTVEGRARTRPQLAFQHVYAAAMFSRNVGEIEGSNTGKQLGFFNVLFANASACVICASAGVEAYVNQLFADRHRVFGEHTPLSLDLIWGQIAKRSTMVKFDVSLALAGLKTPKQLASARTNAELLFSLRNELVHFHPHFDDAPNLGIIAKLKDKMERSPFFGDEAPVFPFGWATHVNTKWATDSAIEFIRVAADLHGQDNKFVAKIKRLTP